MPRSASPLPRLKVPRVQHAAAGAPFLPGGGEGAGLAAFPWDRAAPAGPLILADGSAAAVQTTAVRVAWSEAALWVRFDCADRDAWGTYGRRNDPIYSEEAVEVFLAPGEADPHDYWELEVSPLGTLFAARVHNPTARRADLLADTSWPARGLAWQAAAAGRAQDWWAALAIPWDALTVAGAAATGGSRDGEAAPTRLWRANFYRIERPRNGAAELSCWSPTLTDPPDFHRPARFGRLELTDSGD
jgi:hypothetical protein